MRCLIIPRLIDKSVVAPKYHMGYKADIELPGIPICDIDSLLSSMSVAAIYTNAMPGGMMITQYGLDLCRCGYSYVSDWISPDDYIRIAKYYSFNKKLLNSVYGSTTLHTDAVSGMIRRDDCDD